MADKDVSEMVAKGNAAFDLGNYTEAESLYTAAFEKGCKKTGQVLKNRCRCLLETGNFEEALKDANLLLDEDPRDLEGYALCGKALTQLKSFEEALAVYKKGLEIDPKDAMITEGLRAMQDDILASYEKQGSESSYSAVNLCSQESYPGDGELEALERDILEKWGLSKFPSISLSIPNQQGALKEFKAALQYKKAGNRDQVVDKIKAAIELDPANFMLWAEAAAVLLDIDEPKKAFQYMNVIPLEFRSVKHWKLGGQILNKLELPVMAETWLRQACKLDTSDEETRTLFQRIRVQRLYGPLTQGTDIEVSFTQFGRAVIATRDFEPGEIMFRDKPVVLCQTLDTKAVAACSFCAKCLMRPNDYFEKAALAKDKTLRLAVLKHWPTRDRVPCAHCDREIYCSKTCRDEAWTNFHQIICPSVNPAVGALYEVCDKYDELNSDDTRVWKGLWNASFSPMVLARMWANIICIANQVATQAGREKPSAADWALAKSPLRKFIAYGSCSNAKVIPKMVKLMQAIFETLPEGKRYEISQREFDGRYFQATCNVQAFSDFSPPFAVFMRGVGNEPYRHLIEKHVTKDAPDAMFAGLFPLHACLNHSCDNSVEVLDGSGGVAVKCKYPIKKGEELFTTYINTRMARKQRRAWLYRGYNFWCNCRRCQFEGDGPETCTHCSKEAGPEKKRFPACSKCHRAWYCSTACQKISWKKGHKIICSRTHSFTASSADEFMTYAY